jgi:hypothetical protein
VIGLEKESVRKIESESVRQLETEAVTESDERPMRRFEKESVR